MSRAVSGRRSAMRKATSESCRISLSVSCDTRPILSAVASPSRIIAHLDLDAFFAAVEELERPELATRPLVVGGDPHGRGVVATANYAARKHGIPSAMSCAEALRRCPHAVFIGPRHRRYGEYSRAVWATVQEVVPSVERTGMDEGYLDFGEVLHHFRQARALAEAGQVAVKGGTGLSRSLGGGG